MVEDPKLLEHLQFSFLVMAMEESMATLKTSNNAFERQLDVREQKGALAKNKLISSVIMRCKILQNASKLSMMSIMQ